MLPVGTESVGAMTGAALDQLDLSHREEGDVRLLRAIHRHGMRASRRWMDTDFPGLSQAEAAQTTGLSRPSVSTLSSRLRRQDLLANGDGLKLEPRSKVVCAVDLAHATLRVSVADLHGQLFPTEPGEFELHEPLEADGDKMLRWASDQVRAILTKAEVDPSDVLSVGMSIAGPVDQASGKLSTHAGTLGGDWQFVSPMHQLRRLLDWQDVPFVIDNDANLAILAEAVWGVARQARNALYVKWSDGVGAGLLLENQIFRGADGLAGEIGHTIFGLTKADQQTCLPEWLEQHGKCPGCGRKGCLEAVASLDAMREYLLGHPPDQADRQLLTAKRIVTLARGNGAQEESQHSEAEQERARHALTTAAICIGRALTPLIDAVNPRLIILGGSIGHEAFPLVARTLNATIQTREGGLTPAAANVETVPSSPGLARITALKGAAALSLMRALPSLR
jgi:glucokinase